MTLEDLVLPLVHVHPSAQVYHPCREFQEFPDFPLFQEHQIDLECQVVPVVPGFLAFLYHLYLLDDPLSQENLVCRPHQVHLAHPWILEVPNLRDHHLYPYFPQLLSYH